MQCGPMRRAARRAMALPEYRATPADAAAPETACVGATPSLRIQAARVARRYRMRQILSLPSERRGELTWIKVETPRSPNLPKRPNTTESWEATVSSCVYIRAVNTMPPGKGFEAMLWGARAPVGGEQTMGLDRRPLRYTAHAVPSAGISPVPRTRLVDCVGNGAAQLPQIDATRAIVGLHREN